MELASKVRGKRVSSMREVVVWGALLAAFVSPAWANEPPCSPSTAAGETCACDVRVLHPLQGAIGRDEVRHKAEKIRDKPNKARRELKDDPIKIVRGPDNGFFITDHHHGAAAMAMAGQPSASCSIVARPDFATPEAFWRDLARDHLVWLEDRNGHPITPADLPKSLAEMPDDPYRSLAWRLRKDGGYCRAAMRQKEFAEFIWADWLRRQPSLPIENVRRSSKAMLEDALTLARSPAASALPGYTGDESECPDD